MSQVIVVGAGPGGATLAYLLASRGVDVTLFERQTDFAREFRGEVLLPGGLEPFDRMDLWDRLDSVPHVTLGGFAGYKKGKLIARGDFSSDVFGKLIPRWTSQPALLEMLVQEARQFPNFRFERGARVRDLVIDNDRVAGVELADGREERAMLVVGADGRTSVVRRCGGFDVRSDPTPMDIVWCKLPMPDFFVGDPHLRAYVGGGNLLIAAPTPDDRMQIAWIIAKGSFGEIRTRGMEECLGEMARHVSPDLAAHLNANRQDVLHPFLLSTVSDRVTQWTRPGALVIGDAAHTMSPVGAQGLNIAIRDAMVAANHLVPALRANADLSGIDAAARRVEAERMPEVGEIQRLQALPPRIVLRNAWWSELVVSLALSLIGSRIGRARRTAIFESFMFGVEDVRLSV